jgi:glycosidase
MQFDFIAMQTLYLSLARGDAGPVVDALTGRPRVSPDNQWATFVRNHDELTLDKLTDEERAEVFAAFGPEERMQLYGRGLRRRLPSMLGGDPRRIRMVYSLLFSLPGTPVLFYGEEIGLGENLAVEGRGAVRVPMQWTDEPGAGFSRADPEHFPADIPDGQFGPLAVNVAAQRRDPDSLLNWFERLIRRRRETPELGLGECRVIPCEVPAVLIHRCQWDGGTVVAVHNVGPEPCRLEIPLEEMEDVTGCDDLLGPDRIELDEPVLRLTLGGYGYHWFRVRRHGHRATP